MNHEALSQGPGPQDDAVVGVHAIQRIHDLVMDCFGCEVSECLEQPPPGRHRHLRHRAEMRLTHELRQVGRSRNGVV